MTLTLVPRPRADLPTVDAGGSGPCHILDERGRSLCGARLTYRLAEHSIATCMAEDHVLCVTCLSLDDSPKEAA